MSSQLKFTDPAQFFEQLQLASNHTNGFVGQKNGFVAQQQPNGLNQLADHAYQQQVYADQTNLDQAQRPSTSAVMPPPIKEEFPEFATQLFEPSDIHRDHRSQSITSDGTSTNASYQDSMNGQGLHYEPTIKPRKYRLKPDQEKLNPVYRMKREKNNDAVRRSRDKAKRLQMEKDARLAFLENEHINNKRQIIQLEQRNQMLQDQYMRLKQLCRCGAISGRQP
ncbi:Protein ZIP-4 c [Aphelenchoides avenae]|nr:Protein ZIP-4 c [Aphelenchus avenae]